MREQMIESLIEEVKSAQIRFENDLLVESLYKRLRSQKIEGPGEAYFLGAEDAFGLVFELLERASNRAAAGLQ